MSVADLIPEWRERANEYDRRDREETYRNRHVIAAQQAGLAAAMRVCANELESRLAYDQEVELRRNRKGAR